MASDLDVSHIPAALAKVGQVWRMVVTRGIFQSIDGGTRCRFFGFPPHRAYVVAEARDFVPNRLRIIDFVEGIRFGVVERGQAIAIDGQSACFRFANHPQQSDVGQAGSRIAASYVRVHAGEPYLLEYLAAGVRALVPNRRLEWLSSFINGQRLKSVIHPTTQSHIVKTPTLVDELQESSNRNAQCANRVKNAHEFRARFSGLGSAKQFRFHGIRMRSVVAPAIEGIGVFEFVRKFRP